MLSVSVYSPRHGVSFFEVDLLIGDAKLKRSDPHLKHYPSHRQSLKSIQQPLATVS